MPISGTYTWEETEDDILFKIPFKGKSIHKTNIFLAETILKVSYTPTSFLLDLNLAEKIDYTSTSNRASHKDHVLLIQLRKVVRGKLWGQATFSGSHKEIMGRRRCALLKREEDIKIQNDKAKAKQFDEERFSLKKQMALEQAEWQRIEDMKEEEKTKAERNMYEELSKLNSCHDNDKSTTSSDPTIGVEDQQPTDNNYDAHEWESKDCKPKHHENDGEHNNSGTVVPSIRLSSKVHFRHTPRIFKTPIRESAKAQEEEFIAKNRPYLNNNQLLNNNHSSSNLLSGAGGGGSDISEQSPLWLKRKGDEFYQHGDFLAAINAYSSALEVDKTYIQSLANRSACYLSVHQVKSCINDCEEIIKLLGNDPSHDLHDDVKFQKKVYLRMGCAHIKLCDTLSVNIGLDKLKRALELDPSDESLPCDIKRIEQWRDAMLLKDKGDNEFAIGNTKLAIEFYQESLLKEKTLLSTALNCSAAYFAEKKYEQCIQLCSESLIMLKNKSITGQNDKTQIITSGLAFLTIPAPGSENRKRLVLTALTRKAAAEVKMKRFQDAKADLSETSKVIKLTETQDLFDLKPDIDWVENQIIKNGFK